MKRSIAIGLLLVALAGCMPLPASQPATEMTAAPTTEPTAGVATEPEVTELASEATELTTEPVTEPTTEPVTEPATEPATAPTHRHSYTASQTAPTCAAKGYTKYTCACGDSYKADYVDARGHSYTSQVVAPTTTGEGYTEYSCGVCGHSYKDNYTEKLPVEPCEVHDFRHKDIYKNCQQDGCREHRCIVCGYTYRDEYDYHTPDDHRYNIDAPIEVKEATYEAPGYKKFLCGFCDHVEIVILPQLEVIDTAALESYGRSYAENTYGYASSSGIHASGSGYSPGVYRTITTMEQGKKYVRAAVDARYKNDVAVCGGAYIEVNGEIIRRTVNVYVQPTGDPHVFIIWVYYR